MARECAPDDRQAGGVPVVVRGRESLLHASRVGAAAKGNSLGHLPERIPDLREVKTFDNQRNAGQIGNMVNGWQMSPV